MEGKEEKLLRLKEEGLLVSRPVRQLRKGQVVLLRPEGHPCKIVDMTTAKMLSPQSGRYADGSADYYCDGPHCDHSHIMSYEVRYACLDCARAGRDFDLCTTCEADETVVAQHANGKHVFAKLRHQQNKVDVCTFYEPDSENKTSF